MNQNIPTPHIDASHPDQIAQTVLMPGDPLRAKYIAEKFLENVEQFNETRGMLGFTGDYKGKRVSVMGSGMGIPSAGIYYSELFDFYDVNCIIRIGSIGAMQEDINLKDIVIATAAHTDSNIFNGYFGNTRFAPTPDFDLIFDAKQKSDELGLKAHFGTVKSSDEFYGNEEEVYFDRLRHFGVLGAEMETAALYLLAQKFKKRSLGIYTVSDNIVTQQADPAKERETGYTQMMELALEIAPE